MRLSHHQHTTLRREPSRLQKGYVLVMFAMLLIPMMFVAGLSVDVGSWYDRASDIRKAADAAALAGVVWLPDEGKAKDAALIAAERNGFKAGGDISIDVKTSAVSDRRIKVTITDNSVGSFFYGNITGKEINLTRTSFAEYVLPVPMGSPRNYFGTGKLLGANPSAADTGDELLYLSINTYCTNKVQGDRHQSPYINLGGSSAGANTCGGSLAPDANSATGAYRPQGYEFIIDVPKNPTGPVEVRLYDPRYNESTVPNSTVVRTECTYPWSEWYEQYFSNQRLNGPAEFQTWNSRRDRWNAVETVDDGDRTDRMTGWVRYRVATGPEECTPVYGTEAAIDDGNGTETFTFELAAPDSTPLNDSDNPVVCREEYASDTPFGGYTYLGSVRWNTLCTFTPSADGGRYILRGRNGGTTNSAVGINNFGIVAKYTSAAGNGLCDARFTNTCPRVSGKDAMSVYANTPSRSAEFFLAEIPAEHAGKRLVLELYDAGEGGKTLEILKPSGTDGDSFSVESFDYYAKRNDGTAYGSRQDGQTSINITGSDDVGASKFNAKVIYIEIDLTGYNPPSNNNWWKIRYTFDSSVTDRTTWSARIEGDPIHLVEEF